MTREMGWIVNLARECIAELIGTMILCAFGNASLAVFILEPKMSSSLSVHFSWGMGKYMDHIWFSQYNLLQTCN